MISITYAFIHLAQERRPSIDGVSRSSRPNRLPSVQILRSLRQVTLIRFAFFVLVAIDPGSSPATGASRQNRQRGIRGLRQAGKWEIVEELTALLEARFWAFGAGSSKIGPNGLWLRRRLAR
jgi:hypothetical protein